MRSVTKAAKVRMVERMLLRSDSFLKEAICIIHAYQTLDEHKLNQTRHWNGVGFNKPDAGILSQYAHQIHLGLPLRGDELNDARKRMIKYATQLSQTEELKSLFTQSTVVGVILHESPEALLLGFGRQEAWFLKAAVYSKYSATKKRAAGIPDRGGLGEAKIRRILPRHHCQCNRESSLHPDISHCERILVPKIPHLLSVRGKENRHSPVLSHC